MAKVQSFEELIVWQRAIELAAQIYELTKPFPKEELFGLTSQLRRASVSVSSNIAEGQARHSRGEFIHFLGIARGSNSEVRSQLALIRRLRLGEILQIANCEAFTVEIDKMLNALIVTLKRPLPQPH